jgi:hypothetical protein
MWILDKAFAEGLRDLEYIADKNVKVEARSAEGKVERLPEPTAELARPRVLARADEAIE